MEKLGRHTENWWDFFACLLFIVVVFHSLWHWLYVVWSLYSLFNLSKSVGGCPAAFGWKCCKFETPMCSARALFHQSTYTIEQLCCHASRRCAVCSVCVTRRAWYMFVDVRVCVRERGHMAMVLPCATHTYVCMCNCGACLIVFVRKRGVSGANFEFEWITIELYWQVDGGLSFFSDIMNYGHKINWLTFSKITWATYHWRFCMNLNIFPLKNYNILISIWQTGVLVMSVIWRLLEE